VLEIGGSHVTAAVVDAVEGTFVQQGYSKPLRPSGSAQDILGAILACGGKLPAERGEHWGVATPGPFDYEGGVALFTGVGKFDALRGVDVGSALVAGLPGPPGSVTFLNDAEAFLLGEATFGAARGYRRCIGLTLGTGIGSAFMADGAFHRTGPDVPDEARVDLLEIAGRPLEETVSARAIEAAYRTRTRGRKISTADIAERARRGEVLAGEVLRAAFDNLGRALSPWLERFGATVLVVGGSMTGSWDLIEPALLEGIRLGAGRAVSPLKELVVSVAAWPEQAALLGIARYVVATRDKPAHTGRPARGTGSGMATT